MLSEAARWSSVTGLDDGIQVGIAPGVGAALAVPRDAIADVEQAILDGVRAWQSPALGFDIVLDAPGLVEGPDSGFEIDVFAVPGTHPIFVANPQAFGGVAIPSISLFADRPFTNGTSARGFGITGADIFLNIDFFQLLGALPSGRLDVLTRITIHEFGHALGFGHPNESTNYDTNSDPLDVMQIDPNDPFAGLAPSLFVDGETIMSNQPCGPNPTSACPAVFFTSLRNDDRAARDVLYPVLVPEASTGSLLWLGMLVAGARRKQRERPSARRGP